jgi:predicted TIM-barrel fold metal-dependent hydrolase
VWDLAARPQPWTADIPRLNKSFTIDELRPELRLHRIDATIVVQTIPVAAETPELIGLAATDYAIAGVVGWVDLTVADVSDRLARLAACPNITVKLSGLVTRTTKWTTTLLRPFTDVLLRHLGAHRLMFGSDWPVCLLAASYGEVIGAADALTEALSPSERAALFGGTAARWYGIPAC